MGYSHCIPIPGYETITIMRDPGGPVAMAPANYRPADNGCGPGQAYYSRSNQGSFYVKWANQAVQAVAGGDFTVPASSLNLIAQGGNADGSAGESAVGLGYPAAYGGITPVTSSLMIGGLVCDPASAFVMLAIGIRPTPVFALTGNTAKPPIYAEWQKSYQAQLQQAVLENTWLSTVYFNETCQLILDILPHFTTDLSSGMFEDSSQNGEPLKGNIHPFCKGIEIGVRGGDKTNMSLLTHTESFVETLDVLSPPPAGITTIFVVTELTGYGYCRPFCPVNYCPPGTGTNYGNGVPQPITPP